MERAGKPFAFRCNPAVGSSPLSTPERRPPAAGERKIADSTSRGKALGTSAATLRRRNRIVTRANQGGWRRSETTPASLAVDQAGRGLNGDFRWMPCAGTAVGNVPTCIRFVLPLCMPLLRQLSRPPLVAPAQCNASQVCDVRRSACGPADRKFSLFFAEVLPESSAKLCTSDLGRPRWTLQFSLDYPAFTKETSRIQNDLRASGFIFRTENLCF